MTEPTSAFRQEAAQGQLAALLEEKQIVVCFGAGGVGKTTSSAALGVKAALAGKRVLVLTIDPAKRLADTLEISIESETPHNIEPERFAALGEEIKGSLDIWMVQPGIVFDRAIAGIVEPGRAQEVYDLRIYKAMRRLVSGMQEYMAGESLYQFMTSDDYDLIILDTPPSRNAIDFLMAPEQLLGFLDSRILKAFAPNPGRLSLFGRARKVLQSAFQHVGGLGFLGQVQTFTALILDGVDSLKLHAEAVQDVLRTPKTGHLLITSPEAAALQEARYFQGVLKKLSMPLSGFLVNRSMALHRGSTLREYVDAHPEEDVDGLADDIDALAAYETREQELAAAHQVLLETLAKEAPEAPIVLATPHLGRGVDDLAGLIRLAKTMASDL